MKRLFDPIQFNHLKAKNRLVRSATWEGVAGPDGSLPREAYAIYEELAKGGVGTGRMNTGAPQKTGRGSYWRSCGASRKPLPIYTRPSRSTAATLPMAD